MQGSSPTGVSREVLHKISNHAWNVYPLEAFGYLLGLSGERRIHAALPCSKTRRWHAFDDRWNGIAESMEQALEFAASLGLEVVGLYASSYDLRSGGCPECKAVERTTLGVVLLYKPVCCKSCSRRWWHFVRPAQSVAGRDACALSAGRRFDDRFNQKRILKRWHQLHGPVDYTNGYP